MAGFFLTVLGSYSSVGLTRDKMNTSANVGMIYFHWRYCVRVHPLSLRRRPTFYLSCVDVSACVDITEKISIDAPCNSIIVC